MRFLRAFIFGLGLMYGLAVPKDSLDDKCGGGAYSSETVNVGWGEIGYNRGPLASERFSSCSAVVLDYGNEALLAHSFNGEYGPTNFNQICTGNVVDKLVEESRRRGFYLRTSKAIVNTVCEPDLRKIISDLEKYGIHLQEANLSEFKFGFERDVHYDPESDLLSIKNRVFD